MKANQERVVDLNKKVASLVEKLPAVKVPFADRLPDQKTIVSKYFDFVVKLTESDRDFATAIVNVWTVPTRPQARRQGPHGRQSRLIPAAGRAIGALPTAPIAGSHEPQRRPGPGRSPSCHRVSWPAWPICPMPTS